MPGGQTYTVNQGDCLNSIAAAFGMLPDTIWDANDDLKEKRNNPNALMPGDQLVIPDLRPKKFSGATDMQHKYVRKGVPSKFRLVVEQHQQPIAGKEYRLTVDGKEYSGTTSSTGLIEISLAPDAQQGVLTIPEEGIECQLQFGCLDPLEEVSGAQARLQNLGYFDGEVDGEMSDDLAESLSFFQSDCGLEVSGELDDATKQALLAQHDQEHTNASDAEPPAAAAGPDTTPISADETGVPSEEDDDAVFQAWEDSEDDD